ncbi:MAG: putative lipid II flippase FtsW [Patescibacteria group bacterium]|nr:putative lipid II flippase FtsW [Patescibacteria group bacterium]
MKAFFKRITKRYHSPDYLFIILLGLVLVLGLIFLTSASGVVGLRRFGSTIYFLQHQILMGLIPGLILLVIFSFVDYRFWRKWATVIFILSLILMALTFVSGVGLAHGEARRWISIFGIGFQPAEILKLSFIIYLAAFFDSRQKKIKTWTGSFLPLVIILGIACALVMAQNDMGTMMVIFMIAISIYFLVGGNLLHMLVLFGGAVSIFFVLIKAAPYRMARFITFLYPQMDPLGVGYHINQALIAIGSGGIFGLGLGHSRQKFLYLPESYGDSIFAVIGEELGFLTTILVLCLFVAVALRGLKIAKAAPDFFGQILGGGILCWFIFQAMINIGAMLHLFPLTGIPMPLVSYGGTAMMVLLAAFGILINISRQARE